MKSSTKTVLVVLMFLYITPMIFVSSYDHAAISEEILPDDISFIPALSEGLYLASSGIGGPDSQENDYTFTWSSIVDEMIGHEDTSGTSYVILNFSIPSGDLESFDYEVHAAGANDDDDANLWVWDWVASDWVLLENLATLGLGVWYNDTGITGDYSDGSQISIMANSTDADNPSQVEIAIAWLTVYILDWRAVGTATLIFPVGWDPTFQWGYDAVFIFAGLIMIPLSTMYLVRGGRKGMSMDKLFYGLLIFMVGFGLLVGGIMP